MEIRKAVITAAGRNQRGLPLQTIVDRDGVEKKALEVLVEEAVAAGVEEVAVVVAPGDDAAYREAVGAYVGRVQFLVQSEPRGYGHAIHTARGFTAGQPFLHMVGDHLYRSRGQIRAAQQVAEVARSERCAVSAVQPTRETMLPFFGAIGGRRVPQKSHMYEIETVLEKPTPTEAEISLLIPGLRAGFYLCFFGIHVLTPAVMELLEARVKAAGADESVHLSQVLSEVARRERYLAAEVDGHRYNIGVKYGLLTAQLALALDGVDRERILAQIVDLLAQRA